MSNRQLIAEKESRGGRALTRGDADFFTLKSENLVEEQFQSIPKTQHGGMNEVL